VINLEVTPLRQQPALIEHLIDFFLTGINRMRQPPLSLHPDCTAVLLDYDYPGNIRELRNTVERMAILTPGDVIGTDAVPVELRIARNGGAKGNLREARESAEREHILKALEESKWNVSGAARVLGMERTNLHKRIKALGLSRDR